MRDERPRVILAFDFGLKRIGLATGDTLTGTAAPLRTLEMTPLGPDWAAIERELRSLEPQLLVVGNPYNVDGSPGALGAAARQFAAELARRFHLPVERVDERWSSIEASAALKERRASGRRRVRREHIDSAAAAVILERWLAGEGEPT